LFSERTPAYAVTSPDHGVTTHCETLAVVVLLSAKPLYQLNNCAFSGRPGRVPSWLCRQENLGAIAVSRPWNILFAWLCV